MDPNDDARNLGERRLRGLEALQEMDNRERYTHILECAWRTGRLEKGASRLDSGGG